MLDTVNDEHGLDREKKQCGQKECRPKDRERVDGWARADSRVVGLIKGGHVDLHDGFA